jgi:peptide deformylase
MKETRLRIRIYGDPALKKKSRPVAPLQERHRVILAEMARIMYDSGGIGLAAPQVGLSESMIVADIGQGLYKLINPVIIKKSGSQQMEEGCLSVPGVCIKIQRAQEVWVRARDDSGKPVEIKAEGLFACVLQHEIDHLSGKLIVDHASIIDKLRIKGILKELKKRSVDEAVPEPKDKSCRLQL